MNAKAVKNRIDEDIKSNCVFVVSKSQCPFAEKAKQALRDHNVHYKVVECDKVLTGAMIQVP